MKPFNLEEAKAGKPICTRNGRPARIIATDIKSVCPIAVAITNPIYGTEVVKFYTEYGTLLIGGEHGLDLFMVAEDEEPKCPFKPFDKVLAKDMESKWCIDFFDRYAPKESQKYPFRCLNRSYAQCVPYNGETAHLIGTTDDAPEKYVIW